MERILGVAAQQIYAILRIVTGFLFMWHGMQKLFNFPAAQLPTGATAPSGLTAISAIAGGIELIGGILIMIGLFAGFAAFISSGLMAFAYFIAHFSIQAFLPIQNRGELAVLYCFVLLYIAAVGSGTWSLDSLLNRSKKSRAK